MPSTTGNESTTPTPQKRSLGRRIAGRTTDLIVIGVFVATTLTFGKQVMEWWHAEPAPIVPVVSPSADWGAGFTGDAPVQLEFGDQRCKLIREAVTGEAAVAQQRLIATAERLARTVTDLPPQPDAAETQLISQVTRLKPLREQPGEWRLYQVEALLNLIVAVRVWPATPQPGDADKSPREVLRLVSWGMAFPYAADQWTLYTFLRSPGSPSTTAESETLPVPAGAQRLMSISTAQGEALIAHHGPGDVDKAVRFYDQWLSSHGWKIADAWEAVGHVRLARFERATATQQFHVRVQVSAQSDGWTALIDVATRPVESAAPHKGP